MNEEANVWRKLRTIINEWNCEWINRQSLSHLSDSSSRVGWWMDKELSEQKIKWTGE